MYELNYYHPYLSGNITYSCDMIRLKFYLHEGMYDTVNMNEADYFMHTEFGFGSQCWNSFLASSYRYLFTFTCRDCVITVGLFHNSCDKNTGYHACFMEFNPNKADMAAVKYLMDFICDNTNYYMDLKKSTVFELIRWDLAVDIPIDRHYVRLLKNGKRKYTRIEEKGAVTEYLGRHNTDGFVKVYDKTKESNLYYDLTRIEVTNDSLFPTLPEIHLLQYQTSLEFDFDLNATDKVLVELIRRQEDCEADYWLRQLGRNKREKLKPYVFAEKSMFKFDKVAIMHVAEAVEAICNMQIDYDGGDYNAYRIKSVKQRAKARKQSGLPAEADTQDWKPISEEEWKKHELDYFNNYYDSAHQQPDSNA